MDTDVCLCNINVHKRFLWVAHEKFFRLKYKKLLHFQNEIYYYWNQAGEETPTKARLTSLKTPEATSPAPLKKVLQTSSR